MHTVEDEGGVFDGRLEKELVQTRIHLPVALQTFANYCLGSLQMFLPYIICSGLWLLCDTVCSESGPAGESCAPRDVV